MKTLAIIFGGRTVEHEISIKTAINFTKVIDFKKYNILPVYINYSGKWNIGNILSRSLNISDIKEIKVKGSYGIIDILKDYSSFFDIAVPLIHGLNGEDGTIQGFFETLNIPYTGNGILASSLGIDKIRFKLFFKGLGIVEQVPFKEISIDTYKRESKKIIEKMENYINYPMIIKPSKLGSSIGINIVKNNSQLVNSLEEAFRYDNEIIVEKYIKNREVNIAILSDGENIIVSDPVEINHNSSFYDYNSKYKTKKDLTYLTNTLDSDMVYKLKEKSLLIFKKIGGSGLARLDFFIDENKNILLNEINTLPSIGEGNAYSYMLSEIGYYGNDIVDAIVNDGFKNYLIRNNRKYDKFWGDK